MKNDKKGEGDTLERDRHGSVSVSSEGTQKPSYTHNVDKSEPIDPHLSDKNKPEQGGQGDAAETADDEKVLDRDKSGPASVSSQGKDKPSYTHNADESEPIDPNLADQSGYSTKKD